MDGWMEGGREGGRDGRTDGRMIQGGESHVRRVGKLDRKFELKL